MVFEFEVLFLLYSIHTYRLFTFIICNIIYPDRLNSVPNLEVGKVKWPEKKKSASFLIKELLRCKIH